MTEIVSFCLITLIVFTVPLIVLRFGKQYLTALLPIYLIIGNVFALSFVNIFGVFTSLAIPVYSATFLITDLLSEHFGKEDAKRAVWVGFVGQIVLVLIMQIMINSPLAPETIEAYNKVFSILPRLVIASLVAYVCSQFFDVFIYHVLKQKSEHLWIRNNVSTIVSQLLDTTIFIYAAFWGVANFDTHDKIWTFILSTWVIKIFVAMADTPFLYYSKTLFKNSQHEK